MKKKLNARGIMAVLALTLVPLASARQTFPKGNGQQKAVEPPEASLTLYASQDLMALSAAWMDAYREYDPLKTDIKISPVPQNGLEGLDPENSAIVLATPEDLVRFGLNNGRILCIGREIMLPVVASDHPLAGELDQSGIPVDALNAGLVPIGNTSVEVKYLESREKLNAFIRTGDRCIGICRLADAVDPESGSYMAGIRPVAIDRNDNGKVDYAEMIFSSPESLQQGVWIGKYPASLYNNLYAVTPARPLSPSEKEFISWLVTGGQSFMLASGYSGVARSELYSLRDKISDTPRENPVGFPEVAPLKSFWVISASLLILLAIILIPSLFFRRGEPVSGPGTSPDKGGKENVPGGVFFDRSHTWTFLEKDGRVRVGLDHFFQQVTGPVTRVLPVAEGTKIRKGEAFLTLVRNGKKLQIKSPVTGVVRELNRTLMDNPSALDTDPYQEGWVCTVEPLQWMKETRAYFMADRYREWIGTELDRLKEFFAAGIRVAGNPEPVRILQDGGEPEPGILGTMGPEVWEEFQVQFINKG